MNPTNQQSTIPASASPYPSWLQRHPVPPILQHQLEQHLSSWQLTTGAAINQVHRDIYSKIPKDRHPISHAKRVRDWIARGGLTRGPLSSGQPTLNDGSHSKRRKGKGKGGKKMRALLERGDPSQYLAVEGEECSMWDSNLDLLSTNHISAG